MMGNNHEFYLFFYHEGVKELLLQELATFFPDLKLSFSNKSFLSMKGPKEVEKRLEDRFSVTFSFLVGKFIEKSELENIDLLSSTEVKEGEFWHFKVLNSMGQGAKETIEAPLDTPARAWLKTSDFERLQLGKFEEGHSILEIGAAPGGITTYLLNKGCTVCAIDPAQMDPSLKNNFSEKFTQIKKSTFDVMKIELPQKIEWIVFDLNLPGVLCIKELQRFLSYFPKASVFMTIKCPRKEEVSLISKIKNLSFPKHELSLFHLPSHKKEFGLRLISH